MHHLLSWPCWVGMPGSQGASLGASADISLHVGCSSHSHHRSETWHQVQGWAMIPDLPLRHRPFSHQNRTLYRGMPEVVP